MSGSMENMLRVKMLSSVWRINWRMALNPTKTGKNKTQEINSTQQKSLELKLHRFIAYCVFYSLFFRVERENPCSFGGGVGENLQFFF